VRNLVGTAVAAAVGRASPDAIRELLAAGAPPPQPGSAGRSSSGGKRYRGVRAPGFGLTLARVTYPPGRLEPAPGPGP
jgi:tRNA pseudouridine38-40 synthase